MTEQHNDAPSAGSEDMGTVKTILARHRTPAYRINQAVFEGPVDLLLYLIRKNELDIHEVSLADIASEYLEYVDVIKMIDLEMAGDFIVIASTLMKIKSRSLFTSQEADAGDDDIEETKNELIQYLLEYQKLGGAADKLAEKEAVRHGVYPRGGERGRIVENLMNRDQPPDYKLFDLVKALREVLENAPTVTEHQVELYNITSEMKQKDLMEALDKHGKLDFIEYVKNEPRYIIVVTFVAMLELMKRRKVRINQAVQFGRILIYERTDDTADGVANEVEDN